MHPKNCNNSYLFSLIFFTVLKMTNSTYAVPSDNNEENNRPLTRSQRVLEENGLQSGSRLGNETNVSVGDSMLLDSAEPVQVSAESNNMDVCDEIIPLNECSWNPSEQLCSW